MIFILIPESLGSRMAEQLRALQGKSEGCCASHHRQEERDMSRIREALWKLQGGNREAPAWRKDLTLCPWVFRITGICLP